jgi:hypothetical protein
MHSFRIAPWDIEKLDYVVEHMAKKLAQFTSATKMNRSAAIRDMIHKAYAAAVEEDSKAGKSILRAKKKLAGVGSKKAGEK